MPTEPISSKELLERYPLPPRFAGRISKIGLGQTINDVCFEGSADNSSMRLDMLPWLIESLYKQHHEFTNEHLWDLLPSDVQIAAMKTLADMLPIGELLKALHRHPTPQVRSWAAHQLSYIDDARGLVADMRAVADSTILLGGGPSVRRQVFEVIVRQAIAGAPWRIICQGPMQVNDISEEEVVLELHKRKLRGYLNIPVPPRRDQLSLTDYAKMWHACAENSKEMCAWIADASMDDLWQAPPFTDCLRMFGEAVIRTSIDRSNASNTMAIYRNWLNFAITSRDTNHAAAEAAVMKWYDAWGAERPEHIMWADSPKSALDLIRKEQLPLLQAVGGCIGSLRRASASTLVDVQSSGLTGDSIVRLTTAPTTLMFQSFTDPAWSIINIASRGQFDIPLLVALERTRASIDYPFCDAILEAARHCGFWWAFRTHAILTPKPKEFHMDDRQRPHNEDGPAIKFDDWELYFVHGVFVPPNVVLNKHEITPTKIDTEPNLEIRRVLIDLYGVERYMTDSDARIIDKSPRGILYRKDLVTDEPIVMVKVVNSTAEPDGTFKEYFLRVPPDITSVDAAVAWTFGLEKEEYAPVRET